MTDSLREETERLLAAATPGEWRVAPLEHALMVEAPPFNGPGFPFEVAVCHGLPAIRSGNAALIAAAPSLLTAWMDRLAEYDVMKAEREMMLRERAQLEAARKVVKAAQQIVETSFPEGLSRAERNVLRALDEYDAIASTER